MSRAIYLPLALIVAIAGWLAWQAWTFRPQELTASPRATTMEPETQKTLAVGVTTLLTQTAPTRNPTVTPTREPKPTLTPYPTWHLGASPGIYMVSKHTPTPMIARTQIAPTNPPCASVEPQHYTNVVCQQE